LDEDSELERIRYKKMRELMERGSEETMSVPQNEIDHPIILNDENFDKEVSKYPVTVVDLWAPWCGPCRMVTPIIENLAKEYVGKIVFGKLNVDENPDTSRKFGIMSIPTIIIFKNGKPVDKVVGALPKERLEQRIGKYLPN
jgi:thioredoxin 1